MRSMRSMRGGFIFTTGTQGTCRWFNVYYLLIQYEYVTAVRKIIPPRTERTERVERIERTVYTDDSMISAHHKF